MPNRRKRSICWSSALSPGSQCHEMAERRLPLLGNERRRRRVE
jgi:hypothetical protein